MLTVDVGDVDVVVLIASLLTKLNLFLEKISSQQFINKLPIVSNNH